MSDSVEKSETPDGMHTVIAVDAYEFSQACVSAGAAMYFAARLFPQFVMFMALNGRPVPSGLSSQTMSRHALLLLNKADEEMLH